MTNDVESEVTNMDMPVIASSLIASNTTTDAINVLQACWKENKICKSKVFIVGNVLFFGGFRSKLQYTPTFHNVGMVYDIQPGKWLMSLYTYLLPIYFFYNYIINLLFCPTNVINQTQ